MLDHDGNEAARLVNPRKLAVIREELTPLLRQAEIERRKVQAYAATVGPVSDEHRRAVDAHVARLEEDDVAARDEATHALRTMGHPARVLLQERAPAASIEVRARVAQVLAELQRHHERTQP